MTKLIGITGVARAGKDTLAGGFIKHGYQRLAFADALKLATAVVANEPSHLFFDEVTKEQFCVPLGMTRRQALQGLGNGVRETLGKEVWVRRALRQWEVEHRPPTVITDCRYPNEAEAIKALGGVVIRVVRPGAGLAGAAGQHISEAGVPDDLVDVEISNDGSIQELYAEALKIVRLLESAQ